VPYDFVSVDSALRDLPTLREVLGPNWIRRQREKSALDSDFLLMRFLTTHELRNLVASLDQSLNALRNVEGVTDWHKRLRSNPQEFRAIQAEIAFAMLLLRGGIKFTHPDPPAVDFSLFFDDVPPINIEVIAPTKTLWADDLDGRLWYLSRLYDFKLRTEPLDESPIQDTKIDRGLMLRIVSDSEAALKASPPDGPTFERHWPDIGLKIIWTPSSDPWISGANHPIDHEVHPFKYVLTAARSKVEQMARGHSHTLVLSWNMLPFPAFDQYVRSVQAGMPYWGHFDWDAMPEQIQQLILIKVSYDQAKAPTSVVLNRRGSGQDLPGGFEVLARVMQAANDERRYQDEQETLAWLAPLVARQQSA
jgi:hypothetical protein